MPFHPDAFQLRLLYTICNMDDTTVDYLIKKHLKLEDNEQVLEDMIFIKIILY